MKEQYRGMKRPLNDSGVGNYGNIGYYANQTPNVPYMPPGMGYSYRTQPQFLPPQPTYPQMWFGYNQGQPVAPPVYVDVTKSSKINYDDDDDDDEDDDEGEEEKEAQKQEQEQEQLGEQKLTRNSDPEEKSICIDEVEGISAHGDQAESPTKNYVDETEDTNEEEQEDEPKIIDGAAKTEDKAICIPGTSIVLKTDDDIAKWKEERRKMWLIKISNNKETYRQKFNIKEEELHSNTLQESRKERNFIQNIQNQVKRFHPKPSLTIGLHQRILKEENSKILDFIKELGDANYLKYELTEEEKGVLFGNRERKNDNNNNKRFHGRYDHQANGRGHNNNNNYNYNQNRKKRPTTEG